MISAMTNLEDFSSFGLLASETLTVIKYGVGYHRDDSGTDRAVLSALEVLRRQVSG